MMKPWGSGFRNMEKICLWICLNAWELLVLSAGTEMKLKRAKASSGETWKLKETLSEFGLKHAH